MTGQRSPRRRVQRARCMAPSAGSPLACRRCGACVLARSLRRPAHLPFVAAGVAYFLRHRLDRSAWGLICGAGLLCLNVAYLQRRGPGTIAWHSTTAAGAETYLDPRPWLAAGVLLVLVGGAAFISSPGSLAEAPRLRLVRPSTSLDGVLEEPGQWSFPFFNEQTAEFKWREVQASDTLLLGRRPTRVSRPPGRRWKAPASLARR